MQTPAQAAKRRTDGGGQQLAMPWAAADAARAHLRRGQVTMVVAAPGVGKSILANCFAVYSGAKTLYLSMDTDAFTCSVRLVAMVTGRPMYVAEHGLSRGDEWAAEASRHPKLANLSLAFPSRPDGAEIVHRLNAYREARGDYPELLVVDNLQNIGVGEDEFGGQAAMMGELQAIAVQTQTSILVLHHAVGEYENGSVPIPQSGIRGKLSKFPALILTLHNKEQGRLGVSVVKNRFGPADPGGVGQMFSLHADMEKASITDVPYDDYRGHLT